MLGIDRAAFDSGDLRTHQRRAVFEVSGATLCPNLELLVVRHECSQAPGSLAGRCDMAMFRSRKRPVEMVVRHLHARWHRPEKSPRLICSHEGGGVVSRIEPRLQLTNPISASGVR